MTDWLSDFTLDIVMAALLVGYAKGMSRGYDEGWSERDEGLSHDEFWKPEPPSKPTIEEMTKDWKISVTDLLLAHELKEDDDD